MNPFATMTYDEAINWFAADQPRFEENGIFLPDARAYVPPAFRKRFDLAMDAQPTLVTTSNSGVPAFLANYIDPKMIEILLTPNKAAEILGEEKKGDWVTLTAMFPIVERTGEVSTYGDWNNNGSTGANVNFPQRQSYHYQTITQWGERQLDMAALGKIDWAAQVNNASVIVLNKFQNNSYFYGLTGLQNYGLLNDPTLTAALTPSTKAATGTKWTNNNVVVATANEVYGDIQSLYLALVSQTGGLIDMQSKLTLAMSPASEVAMTATNSFNVNVEDLLKKNFGNIRIVTATQYSTAAGNLVQMIADDIQGQKTGTTAFTEKLRAHAVVRHTSAFEQKKSQGTWGSIIFQPLAISQMLGV
jgi:hypothetical protein